MSDSITGMEITGDSRPPEHLCSGCAQAKAKRGHFHRNESRAKTVGGLIWSDVKGPLVPSRDKQHRWMIAYIDDASGYGMLFTTRDKTTETQLRCFKMCMAFLRSHGHTIRAVKFDGGGECVSGSFIGFLESALISYSWTPRNTSQQNARVEHFWDVLQSRYRTMLVHAELPDDLWTYSAHTVVHCMNRV